MQLYKCACGAEVPTTNEHSFDHNDECVYGAELYKSEMQREADECTWENCHDD